MKSPEEIKGLIEKNTRELLAKVDALDKATLAFREELRKTRASIYRSEKDAYTWINEVNKNE